MQHEALSELAAALAVASGGATPGGWVRMWNVIGENAERAVRNLRAALFQPSELSPEEESILEAAREAGVPVDSLFLAGGVPTAAETLVCRADAGEYLAAATLIAVDGVDPLHIWGTNLRKLRRSHSEIGMDVLAVRDLNAESVDPLGQDEKLFLCLFSEAWAGAAVITSSAWAGPTAGPRSEIAVLAWRDGEAPHMPEEAERVLAYAFKAAQAGRYVDFGCLAGHGRTGTALAALMILAGERAQRSIARVRRDYCPLAIETLTQERYLLDLATRIRQARRS